MNHFKKNDIILLLGFLLVFSYGLNLLHARTNTALTTVDEKNIMSQVTEYLIARDVRKVAEIISTAPIAQQRQVISYLITSSKNDLSLQDKISLILNAAFNTPIKANREELLKMLAANKVETDRVPPIYLIYKKLLDPLMPALFDVLKDRNTKRKWVFQAIYYAINQNDVHVLARLLSNQKMLLTQQDFNALLIHAIVATKNGAIVTQLVDNGANPNAAANGKTPLIEAVLANNQEAVQALLDKKANVNLIIDPAVGSALQIAVKKGYTPIELLLRKNGARE